MMKPLEVVGRDRVPAAGHVWRKDLVVPSLRTIWGLGPSKGCL
jgi:hypothetical protein